MLDQQDQLQSFWIASRALRAGEIPGDIADNLAQLEELTPDRVRRHCVETLCLLRSDATIPRLRRRIANEWRFIASFCATPPGNPQPPAAA
jgi:hypothetical protein